MCPAAAVDALGAAHGGQCQEGAVDVVGVEVVVHARTHDDLRTALRISSVLCEFAANADRGFCGDTSQAFLPCWGAYFGGVVEIGRPRTWQVEFLTVHAIVREHDVEDGGHQFAVDLAYGDAAVNHTSADWFAGSDVFWVGIQVKAREQHLCGTELVGFGDGHDWVSVIQCQVPFRRFHIPAVSGSAAGVDDATVFFHDQAAVGRVWRFFQGLVGNLRGSQELAWGVGAVVTLVQSHQEWRVSVFPHVVQEVRFLTVHVEGLKDDMPHGERQRGVGARLDACPFVGELRVVRKVWRDHDDLGALVAGFDHEVGIRGTGNRDIGAPHHQVGRVVPVAGFWDVGLVAESLWRCRWQVGVPVIEGQGDATDGLQEAHAGAVGNLRHGRNNREAVDAVWAVFTDGVNVCRRGNIDGLFIRNADQTTLATLGNVRTALFWVFLDRAPCQHGIAMLFLFLTEHVHEHATRVWVTHTGWRVGVPGKRRATWAAARLIFRHVVAGGRVIHCLGFPGDHAVFHVDLPRTGTSTVHAVGGTHHLVEGPAIAVEHVRLAAAFQKQLLARLGGLTFAQVGAEFKQWIQFWGIRRTGCVGIRSSRSHGVNMLLFILGTVRSGGRRRSRPAPW